MPGPDGERAVVNRAATHHLLMLRRMSDFLDWFPLVVPKEPPTPLAAGANLVSDHHEELAAHIRWARAAMRPRDAGEGEVGGHRYKQDWRLYNFVRADNGIPDGLWAKTQYHGVVAQALEKLAKRLRLETLHLRAGATSPDDGRMADDYERFAGECERFARDTNWGMWRARLNSRIRLVPNDLTALGPLPGDRAPIDSQQYGGYTIDTDCLYWARLMFALYRLVDGEKRGELLSGPTPGRRPRARGSCAG